MTERTGLYTYDLDTLKAFGHQIEVLEKIQNGYVIEGSITIASGNGYLLGVLWYDTDSENWRIDTTTYGQDA